MGERGAQAGSDEGGVTCAEHVASRCPPQVPPRGRGTAGHSNGLLYLWNIALPGNCNRGMKSIPTQVQGLLSLAAGGTRCVLARGRGQGSSPATDRARKDPKCTPSTRRSSRTHVAGCTYTGRPECRTLQGTTSKQRRIEAEHPGAPLREAGGTSLPGKVSTAGEPVCVRAIVVQYKAITMQPQTTSCHRVGNSQSNGRPPPLLQRHRHPTQLQ